MALPFPSDGQRAFQEGLVVPFWPANGEAWVGNFQQRVAKGCNKVLTHPDGRQGLVVAGGAAYFIDVETRRETRGGPSNCIASARALPELGIILIEDGLQFGAITADGEGWASQRISWDGIRGIVIEGTCLRAEVYSPVSDR